MSTPGCVSKKKPTKAKKMSQSSIHSRLSLNLRLTTRKTTATTARDQVTAAAAITWALRFTVRSTPAGGVGSRWMMPIVALYNDVSRLASARKLGGNLH